MALKVKRVKPNQACEFEGRPVTVGQLIAVLAQLPNEALIRVQNLSTGRVSQFETLFAMNFKGKRAKKGGAVNTALIEVTDE